MISTFQPIVSFPKGRDPKQILRTRPRKLLILCFQLFESRKPFKEMCSLCGQSSHHPLVTVVLYLPRFIQCFLILAWCSQALCLQSLLKQGLDRLTRLSYVCVVELTKEAGLGWAGWAGKPEMSRFPFPSCWDYKIMPPYLTPLPQECVVSSAIESCHLALLGSQKQDTKTINMLSFLTELSPQP